MATRARSVVRHFLRMDSAMPLIRWAMSFFERIGADSGIDTIMWRKNEGAQGSSAAILRRLMNPSPMAGRNYKAELHCELQDAVREHAGVEAGLAVETDGAKRHLAGHLADREK